MTVLDFSIGE